MRTPDLKRFSIAARLWAPTIGLAVVLTLSDTVKLRAEAQMAQQDKLELALPWRGLAEAQGSRRLAAAVDTAAAAETPRRQRG